MTWLSFALMTVVSWGVYGVFLHTGQMNMANLVNGRYKAFLFVGIAYFRPQDPTRKAASAAPAAESSQSAQDRPGAKAE